MRHSSQYVKVNRIVTRITSKYGVRLYEYANVGNHLHLLIRLSSVHVWRPFIRELTGRIAQEVDESPTALNRAQDEQAGFWDQRPFTRVVHGWRRAFATVKEYVHLNHLEGEGLIRRAEIKTLRQLRTLLTS